MQDRSTLHVVPAADVNDVEEQVDDLLSLIVSRTTPR